MITVKDAKRFDGHLKSASDSDTAIQDTEADFGSYTLSVSSINSEELPIEEYFPVELTIKRGGAGSRALHFLRNMLGDGRYRILVVGEATVEDKLYRVFLQTFHSGSVSAQVVCLEE